MDEEQADRHPNNALLFRLAVANSFKRVAESVRSYTFPLKCVRKSRSKIRSRHRAHSVRSGLMQICSIDIKLHQSRPDWVREKRRIEKKSEEEFLRTLTILNANPNVAQKLHKAMIKELYESMNGDLEDILNEGSLQDSLANVCKLSESGDAPEHESVWRPPGNVELHLRSLDAHKIIEEGEKLAEQVQAIENENATLLKEVLEKRSKVSAVDDSVTRSLNRSPLALERLVKRLEQLENCLKVLEE